MSLQPNHNIKILIIPGGIFQLPLVRKAKNMGFQVACFDRSKDSPCRNEVDEFRNIGIEDFDKLLMVAKEINPDAIITDQTDIAVKAVAFLCDKLNLTGIGEQKADLYTNKFKMRIFGKENGFATPDFKICKDCTAVNKFIEKVGYPIILKPISNQSSRGVYKISSADQIAPFFHKCSEYNQGNAILAEEFIQGTEFTAEGFKSINKHNTLAVSQKSHFENSPLVAYKLFYTPTNHSFDYEILRKINDKFVEMSGLSFGITHAEYKFYNGQFYLIEIAARGGGNRISSDLVPKLSSVDTYKYLIENSLGHESSPKVLNTSQQKCGVLEFFRYKQGQIKKIDGIEKSRKIATVIDIVFNQKEGDIIPHPVDDTKRSGFFIAVGDTPEAIINTSARVIKGINIEYV